MANRLPTLKELCQSDEGPVLRVPLPFLKDEGVLRIEGGRGFIPVDYNHFTKVSVQSRKVLENIEGN